MGTVVSTPWRRAVFGVLRYVVAFLAFGGWCSGVPADGEAWGDLRLRFVCEEPPPAASKADINQDRHLYDGKVVDEGVIIGKDGGVANVVAWLLADTARPGRVHPSYDATARRDVRLQAHCGRFSPHVVLMQTTQRLVVENVDMGPVNPSHDSAVFLPLGILLLEGQKVELQPQILSKNPIAFKCNRHTWMRCHILVRESPYMAKSDESGTLEIQHLPAGDHEFVIWHERFGRLAAIPESLGTTRQHSHHVINIPDDGSVSARVPLSGRLFREEK